MKVKVRHGVFETNSSSEHTVCIMKGSELERWKKGELLARCRRTDKDDDSWGNFWSEAHMLEFTADLESAKKENDAAIESCRQLEIEGVETWKKRCLEWKPDPELDEEENEYFARCHRFDQERYERQMDSLNDTAKYKETFFKNHDIMDSGVWFTFEQFWNDLIVDCYSPYQHTDPKTDIALIGKYFHS